MGCGENSLPEFEKIQKSLLAVSQGLERGRKDGRGWGMSVEGDFGVLDGEGDAFCVLRTCRG